MTVQGTATTLLLPPLALVLLCLVAGLLGSFARPRLARALGLLVAAASAAVLAFATPYAAGHLLASLRPEAGRADLPSPSAIVILGADAARSTASVDVGPLTLERLRAGAALARQTGLPVLVTAGPLSPGDPPLALPMARALAEFGITARWVEPAAADTRGNADRSAALLARDGIAAAHVVTHAWHMPRALAAFAGTSIAAIPAPVRQDRVPDGRAADFVPRTDMLHLSWLALREWAGRMVYALRDRGRQ